MTLDVVLQHGNDTSFLGTGVAATSSGGFAQVRYDASPATFAIVRVDGTNDPTGGFTRSAVFLYGWRVSRNTRFTVEDDLSHSGRTHNAFQTQFTVAY